MSDTLAAKAERLQRKAERAAEKAAEAARRAEAAEQRRLNGERRRAEKAAKAQKRDEVQRKRQEIWAEVQVTARPVYKKGIELFPEAMAYSPGFMECVYCTAIIRSSVVHRTCPTCQTKWRESFGAYWFESDWHVGMLEMHREFINGGRTCSLVDNEVEMIPTSDLPSGMSGVRVDNQEVYLYVIALRKVRSLGGRAIVRELKNINARRELNGLETFSVPVLDTVQRWIKSVESENHSPRMSGFQSVA